jgi:hypothetical protein
MTYHEMTLRWRPAETANRKYAPAAIASYADQLRAKGFKVEDDGEGGLLIQGRVRLGPVPGRSDAVGELVLTEEPAP